MTFVDPSIYDNSEIKSQGDRIAELLRRASSQDYAEPSIGDTVRAYGAMNGEAHRIGGRPLEAFQNSMDSARNRQQHNLATQLGANTKLYDLMRSQAEAGNSSAKAVMGVITGYTDDPMEQSKIIEELHKDPEDINEVNALYKVPATVARLGIRKKPNRQDYLSAGGGLYNVESGEWSMPPKEVKAPDYKVVGNSVFNPDSGEFTQAPNVRKPLNATAMKIQDEGLTNINTASGIDQNLSAFEGQIQSRQLDLGFGSNLWNKVRNGVGLSNEESRNFASFNTALEKLRNDSLRLNAGVQTEGDAVRAWNELIANLNDPAVVAQRLAEIREINRKAVEFQKARVNQAREDSGADPMGFDQFEQSQPSYNLKSRSGPAIGAIEEGYRFKGGDPASPDSWEPVQ